MTRFRLPKTKTQFDAVFAELKALGTESHRRVYAKQGAGEDLFGAPPAKLRTLADKLKTNHELALELWHCDNGDAMFLATMILDPTRLTAQECERMIKDTTWPNLIDEFTFHVVSKCPAAESVRERWMNSKNEFIARAGWHLTTARITQKKPVGLDFDALLERIEAHLLKSPYRLQEAMNRCLVEIGCRVPKLTKKCIAIGERLGRFDPRPVPKGGTSTYAPEWIAAVLKGEK